MERTKDGLRILQALPLDLKIEMSKQRIREWYEHFDGMVYIGFSGGKDSSVLLHLVRSIYPDIPAVYCDTGLEFPELKELVRSTENTEILRPKMGFHEVITKYGYPLVSKEVAEAIYYARRNTAQTDRLTPGRKRNELPGRGRNSDRIAVPETELRRRDLLGLRRGGVSNHHTSEWWFRRMLVGTLSRGDTLHNAMVESTGVAWKTESRRRERSEAPQEPG